MKTGCDLVREWRAFPARCSQSELTRLSEMDCGCDAVDGGHSGAPLRVLSYICTLARLGEHPRHRTGQGGTHL